MKFNVDAVECNQCGHHIIEELSASVASMDIYITCPICESSTELYVGRPDSEDEDEDETEED